HQYGARAAEIGDSVLIRYVGDEGTRNDDIWVHDQSVILVAGTCSGGAISPDMWGGLLLALSGYMPRVADAARLTLAAPRLCAASAAARCWERSSTAWWYGRLCGTTGASSIWGRRLLQERDV